jgi:hypothetical protein
MFDTLEPTITKDFQKKENEKMKKEKNSCITNYLIIYEL